MFKHYKLPVLYGYDTRSTNENYTVIAEESEIVPLNSADYLIDLNYYHDDTARIHLENTHFLRYSFTDTTLNVNIGKERKALKLTMLLNGLKSENIKLKPQDSTLSYIDENTKLSPRSLLTEEFNLNGYHITVLFNRIQYRVYGQKTRLVSADAVMLIKKLSNNTSP